MSVKIKIKVTKEVLKESSSCRTPTKECAFAVAVRDILPNAHVLDGAIIPDIPSHLAWMERDKMDMKDLVRVEEGVCFPVTQEMTDFIHKFDSSTVEKRLAMKEKEFELEIPDWVLERIGSGELEEVKRIISSSKTLELA